MRRLRRVLWVAVLVTLLPLPAGAGVQLGRRAPARPQPARIPPATLQLVGVTFAGKPMHRDEFSAESLRHLQIRVAWNVRGRVQHLELVSPDGAIYQRLDTRLDAGTARGRGVVDTVVPVAGSWMTQHSLFGLWTVNVYLDNDQAPTATASFSLNP
jgi:hypothetical protein